jgi:hypothetical protein
MKLDCPHCGERAMSPVAKASLGPARTVSCAACGRAVGTPWLALAVVVALVAAVAAAMLATPGTTPAWITWTMVVMGAILIALAYLYLVPLVDRERHV